jgi:hypothetical protein
VLRFWRMRSLRKFAAVYSSVCNKLNVRVISPLDTLSKATAPQLLPSEVNSVLPNGHLSCNCRDLFQSARQTPSTSRLCLFRATAAFYVPGSDQARAGSSLNWNSAVSSSLFGLYRFNILHQRCNSTINHCCNVDIVRHFIGTVYRVSKIAISPNWHISAAMRIDHFSSVNNPVDIISWKRAVFLADLCQVQWLIHHDFRNRSAAFAIYTMAGCARGHEFGFAKFDLGSFINCPSSTACRCCQASS